MFLRLDLPPGTRFERKHRELPVLNAVIIDFGFVRPFVEAEKAKHVGGTLGYMAPEQVRNDVLDEKTDVYGLAATEYAAMTDRAFFFEYTDKMARARAHLEQEPLVSDALRGDIPEPVFELLRVSTRLDPAQRPTMAQFAEAFARL